MKTTLIRLTLAIFLASLTSISFADTTKITVNGMVCAFCAQGIEKRLSQMPATKSVFVDLKSKIVAVESKDGMSLDKKAISHEITEAGYDVVKTEESKQSVAEIKASLKAKK
jgi:copper chaperone CopZ